MPGAGTDADSGHITLNWTHNREYSDLIHLLLGFATTLPQIRQNAPTLHPENKALNARITSKYNKRHYTKMKEINFS